MDKTDIPQELVVGGAMPPTLGLIEDDWYYEEDMASTRMGIKIEKKLHQQQSQYQKIAVYQTAFFGKLLTLDDVVMLTERDEFVYHEMLTHLPLCSIPNPKQVLIIGGGDCGCLREVLKHPDIEKVVQCDIDREVTQVCEKYFGWTQPAAQDPRAQLLFEDGVALIENSPKRQYDLVIIDSTDPVGMGVGLFLRDFYKKVARVLKPGGVMVAQTESPHFDTRMYTAIYRELATVFPKVSSYLGFIPTYPSGCWSWAYASLDRFANDYFDSDRAGQIEKSCKYYNQDIQQAAFVLPNFVKRALDNDNLFASFEKNVETKEP